MLKSLLFCIISFFAVNFKTYSGLVKPRSYSAETRFKSCTYDPKSVYYITLHVGYPMYLEFDIDEKIDTMYTPNKRDFEIVPVGNRLFLKALNPNSETTLTVMTNQRNYFFELHVKNASGPFDKDITFFVKFNYLDKNKSGTNGQSLDEDNSILQYTKTELPDLSQTDKYNFNYTMSGDISIIGPEAVFDDGRFTYFKFREYNAIIPAIFLVDNRGFEQNVNYRMVGDYIIVEANNKVFTLRRGADTVCVFNETLKLIEDSNLKNKVQIRR